MTAAALPRGAGLGPTQGGQPRACAAARRNRRRGFRAVRRDLARCRGAFHAEAVCGNEEFRPGAGEVDHARRVIAAYDKALAEGIGPVTVDGKMIDVPIVERARLLLERETAITARKTRMRETTAT